MKRYLLPLALLLVGCGQQAKPTADSHDDHDHGAEETEVATEVHLTAEQQKIAGIEVAPVEKKRVGAAIEIPGVVTSKGAGRAAVTPPVAGRLTSVKVQIGSPVRAGQTLAVLESVELAEAWAGVAEAQRNRDSAAAASREARSEIAIAEARVRGANVNLTRQKEMARLGAFNEAPVQAARSELNEAQSELLSIQKEQTSHAELFRRLENLFRNGIVSRAELEAARLELEQDEIRLSRANARISAAKATYDREQRIADRGLLNAREVQTAEADVRTAQLELDRARIRSRSADAALTSAKRGVANAEAVYRANRGSGPASVGRVNLVAPMAGIVSHIDVTQGQAVDRTQVLMEIENPRALWVVAHVPERQIAGLQKGSTVNITSAATGATYQGVVEVVGTRAEAKARTVEVYCRIDGDSSALKPEMTVTVAIATGRGAESLSVPTSALVREEGKTFVFVKGDDHFERKEVETGEESAGITAIRNGLEPGDIVVVKGAFVLSSELKKGSLKGHEH